MRNQKVLKRFILLTMVCVFTVITNICVYAKDKVGYFDSIFVSGEFRLYTDAEIGNNEDFTNQVNSIINRYGISEYYNPNGDSSYLYVYVESCNFDNKTCNFVLNRSKSENNEYSNETVKRYEDIVINTDNDIGDYFPMLNNNNIIINYDENMFDTEEEKENYISSYVNNLSIYEDDSEKYYSYDNYSKILYMTEYDSSNISKIVSKNNVDIVFEYNEEEYSDEFKELTSGTLTIKSDCAIDEAILSDYLNSVNNTNYYFAIDGNISDNKVFIKMQKYNNGSSAENHLVTLVKDSNIDLDLFDKVGYQDKVNIKANEPLDINDYVNNYFNVVNYYFYDNDISQYYDAIFNYDADYSSDSIVIKYTKNKNGKVLDMQFHKIPIDFVGYSNTYSDRYNNKIGNEITINADELDLDSINSNIDYSYRALGCNEDYSVCDIAMFDYDNNTVEIHKVNIKLDNTISDLFRQTFNIKENQTIDIIVDNNLELDNYFSYYYYDNKNMISTEFTCEDDRCNLALRDYKNNKREAHQINFNLVNSSPTSSYLSLVKSSVDIYPGEINDIWSRLTSSNLFAKNKDNNTQAYSCDKKSKKCLIFTKNSNNNLEIHYSSVNIKDGKSKEFSKAFPTNTIKLNSIYKDDMDYIGRFSMAYLMSKTKTWSYLDNYDNGKALVTFDNYEAHTMNVEFAKGNNKHKEIVEEAIDKIGNENMKIVFDDLEYINNFYYNGSNTQMTVNYNSQKLNDTLAPIINNKHINYFFVEDGGLGDMFMESIGGRIILFYDGIAYGMTNSYLEATMNHIIYIPDDTLDTKEAYIKAAQKRIDDYLGKNSGVVVNFSRKIDSNEIDSNYMDVTGYDGNSYIISYKNKEEEFIIVKNSSKMQSSTFNAVDVNNNIMVSSKNANYPMSTVVSSQKLEKDKYEKVLNKLGLEEAEIIDIDLYSPSVGDIKDFNGVNFNVSIPIDLEKFEDEELYAYYIDDNGKIEQHPISVDDFIGSFETNHFSTYIIGKKIDESIIKESNPKTGDDIINSVILASMSLIILVSLYLYVRKTTTNY